MTAPARRRRGPAPERLQSLMEAAAEIFLERGYDATSVQDIADSVGLLKGSLYHYVSSKEDFLFGIIEPVYGAALETVRPVATSGREPLVRLAEFARAHVHFVADNLSAFKIRLREFSQLSPSRQESLSRSGDEYYATLGRILADARSDNMLDPSLDLKLTTLTVIGQLNSMAQWYRPGGRHSPAKIARQLSGSIVASVASDAAIEKYGGTAAVRAL